jgi:O-antigen biosynthesis protein
MKSHSSSVIAIVPVWNARNDLLRCLESLLTQNHTNLRVIIADNNSQERTDDLIEGYRKSFAAKNMLLDYVRLDDNYGPTGAMNRVLEKKYYDEEYILRIDSDVQINDHAVITKLISFLEKNPSGGIVGPKMVVPASNSHIVAAYWISTLGTIINRESSVPVEADMVNAGFVLVKGKLYKTLGHLWSEILFYSWEELDLSERGRKAGYKTYYYPDTSVIHHIRTMGSRSKKQVYYDFRNLLLVNWKYGNTSSRFMNFFVLFLPRIIYWLFFKTQWDLMTLLRALKDFFVLRKNYTNEFK